MKKIRLLPPLVTFGAGTIASILLYLFGCDLLTMLIILFAVLVIFYVLGVVAMKILMECPPKAEDNSAETEDEETQKSNEAVKG